MSGLYIRIFGVMFLALILSCASSKETTRSDNANNGNRSLIKVDNSTLPLSDYLRRVPGLSVMGSGSNVKITIRGTRSFTGTNEPLYVLDGQRVGRSYSEVVDLVPVTDIDHIRVLKGAEASAYGVEGANGIIEITTKRR